MAWSLNYSEEVGFQEYTGLGLTTALELSEKLIKPPHCTHLLISLAYRKPRKTSPKGAKPLLTQKVGSDTGLSCWRAD